MRDKIEKIAQAIFVKTIDNEETKGWFSWGEDRF
jgi:hypothetical protein